MRLFLLKLYVLQKINALTIDSFIKFTTFVKHNHNNEPNSYLSSRNARLTIDLKYAPSHITNVS